MKERNKSFWPLLSMAVAYVLGGCQMSPDYPVSRLVFDEGLVGTWRLPPPPPESKDGADPMEQSVRVVIEARNVPNDGSRVNPPISVVPTNTPRRWTKQYWIRASWQENEAAASAELEAYLIDVGERRLIGVQLVRAEVGGKIYQPLFPLLLPVHLIARIERKGDELRLEMPKDSWVVWMPMIKPLDSGAPNVAPSTASAPSQHLLLAGSVDRLLEYYATIAANNGAWELPDEAEGEFLVREKP